MQVASACDGGNNIDWHFGKGAVGIFKPALDCSEFIKQAHFEEVMTVPSSLIHSSDSYRVPVESPYSPYCSCRLTTALCVGAAIHVGT